MAGCPDVRGMERPKLSISFLKKGETNSPEAPVDLARRPAARGTLDKPVPLFGRVDARATEADGEDPSRPSSSHQVETTGQGAARDETAEDEAWPQVGLVVRVREATLSSGLYDGMAGIVKAVVGSGGYGADIQTANGDILRLDQDNLQTMVPSPGDLGLIVRGPYRDTKVRIVSLGKDDVEVELEEGRRAGHRLLLPASHVSRHIAIK